MPEPTASALREHLTRAWPKHTLRVAPATAHAREAVPDLQIARLAPPAAGEPWVYATLGAGSGLEFVLLSPREDERHVETLSSVAYFHSFYGLEEGSVYRVARGWFFDSACDRFLFVTVPELPGFLRCLPITQEEAELLKSSGQQTLEAKFAKKNVNFLDPKRASSV